MPIRHQVLGATSDSSICLTTALCVQAQAKAVTEGKSAVAGVTYHKHIRRWCVQTLSRWGVQHRHLATAKSREEAEAIAATYYPRLQAAAAEGSFEEEFVTVKASLHL